MMSLKPSLQNLEVLFRYGFVPHKPLLMTRVATNYFKALVSNPKPLHYIDFVTDYKCNFRCQHCFATTLVNNKKSKMTLADYHRIAKEAMALGVIHFSFQGGEPLLDTNLPQIIAAFQPHKNFISITTNGSLLDKNHLSFLKKIGVDKITISIDSAIHKEHNRFRHFPHASEKAWQGMRLALKKGFRVTINTTITHQNLHSPGIQKLISWATAHKVIINPIFACPVGRWSDNKKILMTPQDRQYIDSLKQKSIYIRRDMNSNWFDFGCPAAKEVLYVSPYGDVMPCPFLHLSLGNLKDKSLKQIRAAGIKHQIFKTYHHQCLASENREFIKKYLQFIKGKKLPINISENNITLT